MCYNHAMSNKPHPLCGCLNCNTIRKLYVGSSIVACLNCKCGGHLKDIKKGHPNQCNVCGHKFTKHYCF